MYAIRFPSALLLATLSFSLIAPEQARAQEHAQVVWDQLKMHHDLLASSNYAFLQYVIGSERQSGKSEWTLSMDSGTSYALTAACDNDCGDVDIRVRNAYGEELAEDADESDSAIIQFSPAATGQYTIEVEMYQCQQEPCYYGIGMFYQAAE
jgi:hypothetical protein